MRQKNSRVVGCLVVFGLCAMGVLWETAYEPREPEPAPPESALPEEQVPPMPEPGIQTEGQLAERPLPDAPDVSVEAEPEPIGKGQATEQELLVEALPMRVENSPADNRALVGYEFVRIPSRQTEVPGEYEVTTGTVPAFQLGKYEVTVRQFRRFCAATRHRMPRQPKQSADDHPVVFVTWDDADAFCKWIGGRLPAGEEWDWAAQGGSERKHVWGNQWPPPKGAGNFADVSRGPLQRTASIPGYDDGHAGTAPVGSFRPNGYGLHDMATCGSGMPTSPGAEVARSTTTSKTLYRSPSATNTRSATASTASASASPSRWSRAATRAGVGDCEARADEPTCDFLQSRSPTGQWHHGLGHAMDPVPAALKLTARDVTTRAPICRRRFEQY